MSNYFLLSGKHEQKVASAFAPEGTKLAHELIPDLENTDTLPFELNLVKLVVGKNGLEESRDLSDLKHVWLDYQPNSLAWPLMSEKMKFVIERHLTGNEGIGWIKATLIANDERRIYYIPRFATMLDVIDKHKTTYVPGTDRIIRPVFSLTKLENMYSVFHLPSAHNLWKITSGLYISESLKKAIQKEKLTGVDFEKTAVA